METRSKSPSKGRKGGKKNGKGKAKGKGKGKKKGKGKGQPQFSGFNGGRVVQIDTSRKDAPQGGDKWKRTK